MGHVSELQVGTGGARGRFRHRVWPLFSLQIRALACPLSCRLLHSPTARALSTGLFNVPVCQTAPPGQSELGPRGQPKATHRR